MHSACSYRAQGFAPMVLRIRRISLPCLIEDAELNCQQLPRVCTVHTLISTHWDPRGRSLREVKLSALRDSAVQRVFIFGEQVGFEAFKYSTQIFGSQFITSLFPCSIPWVWMPVESTLTTSVREENNSQKTIKNSYSYVKYKEGIRLLELTWRCRAPP